MSCLRKQKDREDLQRALLYTVLWICVIFYAFAGGVWSGEQAAKADKPQAPETACTLEEPAVVTTAAVTTPPAPMGATSPDKGRQEQAPVPDICEDTYLIEGHALDYETQMLIYGACLEFGVDYQLVLAMMEQETGYRNIIGDGGDSYGYLQVQRKWHEERMAQLGVTDLMDPESNFRVACHFLRECIDKYGLERGLGFYNSGQAVVTDYSREVMGRLS